MLAFEVIPLCLYGIVCFQFRIAFRINSSDTLVNRYQVVEQQCVHAFALIFRQDTRQVEVDHFRLALQSLQQINPTEREKMPFRFLHSLGQVGKRDSETDHFVVFLTDDKRHQVIAKHRNVHIDVVVDLLLSQTCEAV